MRSVLLFLNLIVKPNYAMVLTIQKFRFIQIHESGSIFKKFKYFIKICTYLNSLNTISKFVLADELYITLYSIYFF